MSSEWDGLFGQKWAACLFAQQPKSANLAIFVPLDVEEVHLTFHRLYKKNMEILSLYHECAVYYLIFLQ